VKIDWNNYLVSAQMGAAISLLTPSLAKRPKLLIPDIKGEAHIVFETGALYPHHNHCFVTSDECDLRALRAVLLSTATLVTSPRKAAKTGEFLEMSAMTGLKTFVASLAGHSQAEAARLG
jgi:hypothetical protein